MKAKKITNWKPKPIEVFVDPWALKNSGKIEITVKLPNGGLLEMEIGYSEPDFDNK